MCVIQLQAVEKPSTARRNELWPAQPGGAWTDSQQPQQGSRSCSVPAPEPKHRPGTSSKQGKAGKATHTRTQARAGAVPEPRGHNHCCLLLRGLTAAPAPQCGPRNKQSDRGNTSTPAFSPSQTSSFNGEKGQGGSLCRYSAIWPKHVNLLVNICSQLQRGGGRPREQDEKS